MDNAKLVHRMIQREKEKGDEKRGQIYFLRCSPLRVSPLRRVTFSLRAQRESNQRESAPGIRVSLRETPLAPALFRGSSRWAIPGPSFLVWHPCQTPLSTAPPLLAALALRASLRLLLRSATFRPPDGIRGPRCLGDLWRAEQRQKRRGHGPLLRIRRMGRAA